MKTSNSINISSHPVMLKNFNQHRGRFVWGRFDRQTWGRFGHTPGDGCMGTFMFGDVLTGHQQMRLQI